MGVVGKAKAGTVGVSITALLGWLAVEVYQLKQEAVEHRVAIEHIKETVEDHRQSQQELIKLHLK
jgi:hypothetical protein